MPGKAIEVRDLVKIYKKKSSQPVRALDGVSLGVERGHIFGLLGPNGAGKTTLLRILTTLCQPTGGQVMVLGYDVRTQALEVRKNICVVLQENAVEQYLSVRDNLLTYAKFHSVAAREAMVRAERAIDQFGLAEHLHQKVIDLSGGLRRRVQVAKVFMVDKPLTFLDEATTGMDPLNKRATLDAIRSQAQRGRTMFLTTHILHEAEELCDSFAIIHHGRIIASGDLQSIRALASDVFDISITFQQITDGLVEELRQLPLLKFSRKDTTVDMSVRGAGLATLEHLTRIARGNPIVRFDVSSATLEDIFLELLEGRGT